MIRLYLLFFFLILGVGCASAITEPAPGPNTMEVLCSSGRCITNDTLGISNLNQTSGFYPVGHYQGGTALSQTKLIGIQLSDSCLKLIISNTTTNCPTYDKLKIFDNTNPIYDGVWVETPYYHRLITKTNEYNFYTDHYVIMVDPNGDFTTHARMIIIQPDHFTYINPDDVITNHTRIEYHDRFVTACEFASVSPDIDLIFDTIKYFENGCKYTSFNDTKKVQMNVTPFDYNNPFSTLYYTEYIHEIKTDNIGDCIHSKCKYTDPYKNPDW